MKTLCAWSLWLYFLPKIRYEKPKKEKSPFLKKGGAIIVTNHKNYMDFLLFELLFVFKYLRCVVGKTLYESHKFITVILNLLGAVKVDRFSFDMNFFFETSEALKKGQKVLIFPEGRFSVNDEILEFKNTASLLAVQTNVPVVPIYHSTKYLPFRPVKVMVGEPINLSDYVNTANPDAKQLEELTKILRDKIIELKDKCEKEM